MKVFGLTGAPGCGKSAVLKMLAEFGRPVADADAFCAKLHAESGNAFHRKLRERWGESVLLPDGSTNKAAVAERVFNNDAELAWLENELYPAILEQAEAFFRSVEGTVIFEVPLLFEKNWQKELAGTIAVWTPEPLRRERLKQRGWDDAEIDRRSARQFSADKKLELADYGLINDSSLDFLREQCWNLNKLF